MQIAIIGAGYVGLTTGVCLAHKGHTVTLVEQLEDRLRTIRSGKAPFFEPGLDELIQQTLKNGRLLLTNELPKAVAQSAITLIAVGTPDQDGQIDLSQVEAAASSIGQCLSSKGEFHTVVVKSTVVPGTTDGAVRSCLEKHSGLKAGEFGLCMNPEFLREGSAVEDFLDPDRIVIGEWDANSGAVLHSVYESFDCQIVHTTLRNAELTKYSSNSLLSVLISFSNELAAICEQLPDTDIDTVMDGLHLDRRLSPIVDGKRISPQILSYLRAGCGYGGSCLPKDVNALRQFAANLKVDTPLLNATVTVNSGRGEQILSLLEDEIGSLSGKKIGVLGLAFKPGTDDLRESPALKIINSLIKKRAKVFAYDPMVGPSNLFLKDQPFTVCGTMSETYSEADALVIATAWPQFREADWKLISQAMKDPVILDGRRMLSAKTLPPHAKLISIGVAAHEKQLNKEHAAR